MGVDRFSKFAQKIVMKKLVTLFSLLMCSIQVWGQIPLKTKPYSEPSKVVFSPSGRSFFLALGNEAVICNSSGETIAEFKTPDAILAIAFSPNERFISTAESSGRLTIWDTTGKLIKSQNNERLWLNHSAVAYSPDGSKLVQGKDDNTAFLLDINGEFIAALDHSRRNPNIVSIAGGYSGRSPLQAHYNEIVFVKFSPDGSKIFTSSQDSSAFVWDKNGKLYSTINNPYGMIKSMDFTKDGKILTGHESGQVVLWTAQGKQISVVENLGEPILSIQYASDGLSYVYTTEDGVVVVRKNNGEVLQKNNLGADQRLRLYALSPRMDLAVCKVNNKDLIFKDLRQKVIKIEGAWIESAFFVEGKDQIVILERDQKASYWSVTGNKAQESNFGEFFPHKWAKFDQFATSSDGKKRVAYSSLGPGLLFNDSLQILSYFLDTMRIGFQYFAAISPDGRYLFTGNESAYALREIARLNQPFPLPKLPLLVSSAVFSPDNESILLVGFDGTAIVIDKAGKILQKMEETSSRFMSGIFSPDGKTILLGNNAGMVSKWDLNGKQIYSFGAGRGNIISILYAPSGQAFFTIDLFGEVKKWNFEGLPLRFNILPPSKKIFFSKDGKYGAAILASSVDQIMVFELIKE